MSTALSVNLNKIALIRNSREGDYPNVVDYGRRCLNYGADGITVHPRPDQRHIRASDIAPLKALCDERGVEFNIEGNPFAAATGSYPGFVELVETSLPAQVTLVPDSNDQLTSDHGFDMTTARQQLTPLIARFKALGIRVSLFMDPDIEQITLAKQAGADRIELYTGPYAWAVRDNSPELDSLYQHYQTAAAHARAIGLELNAGHDLNLDNLARFLQIPGIDEVSIGHALTVDALDMGLEQAIKAYAAICHRT